ncbi:MAG: hypothetical protein ACREV8_13215, partial [Gammaproteobacteria bacterium]
MTGESRRRSGDADEASEAHALPGWVLAPQVQALPGHGLQRLLALEDHVAPLLVDQGDGAPRWYQRDKW